MSRKTTNDLLKGRLIKDKFMKDNLGNDKFQDILKSIFWETNYKLQTKSSLKF